MRTWNASRTSRLGVNPAADARARSWSHILTLYLVLLILASYVGLDLYTRNSGGVPGCSRDAAVRNLQIPQGEPAICSRLEGHYDTLLSTWNRSSGDPWRQLKWVGEPAFCKVRGQLIEKIDHWNNFRRGWALKHAKDVEDRLHIMPWLYGSKVDLNTRRRRVYLDLGANTFSSSIKWFTHMYPCDFTEIHAFEIDEKLLKVPTTAFDEDSNYAAPNKQSIRLKKRAGFPQWMLDRIHVYHKYVADRDDAETASINITRFVKEELKLKADDTVVVKMDIEGAEWAILTRWMNDPEMVAIVDELFVEIHYDEKSMWDFHWARFAPRTRKEAKLLLAKLRWKGIYAHFWP